MSKLLVHLVKTTATQSFVPARTSIALFATKQNEPQLKMVKQKDYFVEPASICENDKILCFVENNFLKEEPIYRTLIPGEKVRVIKEVFRSMLNHTLSVVARNACTREIVGVSINEISCKLDGQKLCRMGKEARDPNLKKLFEVWATINLEPKLFEKLGRDDLFHIAVITVDENHWGKGIGIDLVKRSLDLAREKNFELAKLNATTDNIRKIAMKFGMKNHWTKSYKEIMCRGVPPRALPAPPHSDVNVFYMNLKCPC